MTDTDRPSDHRGLEVLTAEECDRLLSETPVGRVGFLQAGEIHVLPVNYRFYDNNIVLRTTLGSKMEAAEMHHRFAFEIDHWDAETRSGWSVLARGHGRVVEDEDEVADLESLGLESWAEEESADLWIRIVLDDVTGRRVR